MFQSSIDSQLTYLFNNKNAMRFCGWILKYMLPKFRSMTVEPDDSYPHIHVISAERYRNDSIRRKLYKRDINLYISIQPDVVVIEDIEVYNAAVFDMTSLVQTDYHTCMTCILSSGRFSVLAFNLPKSVVHNAPKDPSMTSISAIIGGIVSDILLRCSDYNEVMSALQVMALLHSSNIIKSDEIDIPVLDYFFFSVKDLVLEINNLPNKRFLRSGWSLYLKEPPNKPRCFSIVFEDK